MKITCARRELSQVTGHTLGRGPACVQVMRAQPTQRSLPTSCKCRAVAQKKPVRAMLQRANYYGCR
jgi:hypothetical protein